MEAKSIYLHPLNALIIFQILFYFGFCHESFSQITDVQSGSLVIGEQLSIYSKILDEGRMLNVYLPDGYDGNDSLNYPVIYVLDGSMNEDFIHVTGVVQFLSFSWIAKLPPSIVVGIANVDRKRDFTYPSQNEIDQKEFPTSGHSSEFIDFIQNEVQPLIKSNYSTTDQKTIIGQSLGGLLAAEILLKRPQLFDNYIIVSPSLWWDDESLLKLSISEVKNKNIYVAVGKEGEIMERLAQQLYVKLKEAELRGSNIFFKYLEGQDHGDALHLAVYDAFERFRLTQKKNSITPNKS